MRPEHPAPRPGSADVGRAMAAAVVSGGSTAELQRLVRAYVRDLKRAGVPPEHALIDVKEVLGLSKVRPCFGPDPLAAERLAARVVEWFVAAYYGGD